MSLIQPRRSELRKFVDQRRILTFFLRRPIAQVPIATKDVLNEAVDAGQKAFLSWSKKSWAERAKLVKAVGEEYKTMIPQLSALLVAEQGKSMHA